MQRRFLLPVACLATMAMASTAMGKILGPGSSDVLSGVTASGSPQAYGSIVHSQIDNFNIFLSSGPVLFSGTLKSTVRQNSAGNLTFDLAIVDSTPGWNGVVESVSYRGFAGWVTDVDWRSDEAGLKAPASASRSGDGDTVSWNPLWSGDPGIFSGESSRKLFASTDAAAFSSLAGMARVTLTTGEYADIVVAAPVPAPGALALLGLAGCTIRGRRRRLG